MSVAPPPDAVPIELNGQVHDPHEAYAKDAKKTNFIVLSSYDVLRIPEEEKLEELHVDILEDLGDNNYLCNYKPADLAPLRALSFVRQVDVFRTKFKIPAALQALAQPAPAPAYEMMAPVMSYSMAPMVPEMRMASMEPEMRVASMEPETGPERGPETASEEANVEAGVEAATAEMASMEMASTESFSMMETTSSMGVASMFVPPVARLMIDIFAHSTVDEDDFEDLKGVIAEAAGVSVDDLECAPGQVRLEVDLDKLEDVAKDDRIHLIEQVLDAQLMCVETAQRPPVHAVPGTEHTATSESAAKLDTAPATTGTADEGTTPYLGQGQIVTVTDTGFDRGDAQNCHAAFAGRVHSLRPINRKDVADDPHGHGTHVSGILLGSPIDTDRGRVGGVAPAAQLIVQSLFKSDVKPFFQPLNLLDIFTHPHALGSCVFSNSWGVGFQFANGRAGPGTQPSYMADNKGVPGNIDDFIRAHPEAVVCFSAGNDQAKAGGSTPTVGRHAGAKNVLTVGATAGPDQLCMNPMSSAGPTADGRLKPDVVAPGTDIYAALSRRVPVYVGAKAVARAQPDVQFRAMSGTSQATPAAAGVCALVRQALLARGCARPPGALVKAAVIAGADRLPGVDVNAQGWGRVNRDASVAVADRRPARSGETGADGIPLDLARGSLIGEALRQDQEYEFRLALQSPAGGDTHFKITMVYNDLGKAKMQNNLNLFVTDVAAGTETPGNNRSLTDLDQQNNVEQVVLAGVPQGEVKVRVHAQKILAKEEQDYVLAWTLFTPLPGVVY